MATLQEYFVAVEGGDTESAAKALEKLEDINEKDDDSGYNPLLMAVRFSSPELVALAIAKGAETNAFLVGGTTSLHLAARADYRVASELVEMLLSNGADPNAADVAGVTPLMAAGLVSRHDLVQQLIAAGADLEATDSDGFTILHRSVDGRARKLDWELASLLIHAGSNVNAVGIECGRSPLILLMSSGRHRSPFPHLPSPFDNQPVKSPPNKEVLGVASILLDAGAHVDHAAFDGHTALIAAIRKCAHNAPAERVEWLLDHGAALDLADCRGASPLHAAMAGAGRSSTCIDVACMLFQRGADVHALDADQHKPSHSWWMQIRSQCHDKSPSGLLQHALQVTYIPYYRLVPLLIASFGGTVPRINGLSPLHWWFSRLPDLHALRGDCATEIVRVLVGLGDVDVNEPDTSGRTPAHWCFLHMCKSINRDRIRVMINGIDMLAVLLEAGGKLHIQSGEGHVATRCCEHHAANGWSFERPPGPAHVRADGFRPEEVAEQCERINKMVRTARKMQGASVKAAKR